MILNQLREYAIFLGINFIFILLIARVIYFTVNKVDPIKAVKPNWFINILTKEKKKRIDDEMTARS